MIPWRTLIYGERDSELSCILVAGIKRAFSLTTDHIPGILPRQHIPENKCGLGHSPRGGVRLGGHIIQGDGIFDTLNHRFYGAPPPKRDLQVWGEVIIFPSYLRAAGLVENKLT